ncbi:carbohydrate ABC transporter permease [Bosea thiooxidans]|nr:sugar ABC transporter permease [Bosea sp. (in: a-proteobacteria)]
MTANSRLLFWFIVCPMTYIIGLIGLPVAYNALMSVQDVQLSNLGTLFRPFVGLTNFATAASDPLFRQVALNTAVFVVCNLIGQVGLGTIVAAFLSSPFPGSTTIRGLLLVTWILPGLVVGTVWKWMFATQYGVVNFVLHSLGVIDQNIAWLSDPRISMTALNVAHIWFGMPFSMILIAAALTSIPRELYEAAAIDGAGPIRRFLYITLPSIKPAILAVCCLIVVSALRAFDVIVALTQGGPVNATNVLPLFAYQTSFVEFNFGIGAAIGSFAFLLVFIVALVYVRTIRSEQSA